jgi:hypothetical protein
VEVGHFFVDVPVNLKLSEIRVAHFNFDIGALAAALTFALLSGVSNFILV